MALSIDNSGSTTITRLATGDSLTNWSVLKLTGSGGAPSLFQSVGTIDLVSEGSNAVATKVNKQRVVIRYSYPSGIDLTPDGLGTGALKYYKGSIFVWSLVLAAGSIKTKALGGYQIELIDGSGGIGYWNVAGSDTYSGGFVKWAIGNKAIPSSGAIDESNIVSIGVVTDVGGTTTRFDNFVVDAIDVGHGLTFTGSTTTDALLLEASNLDAATSIGILEANNGILFCQADLKFSGSSLQVSDTETLVFTDTISDSKIYDITLDSPSKLSNTQIRGSGAVTFNAAFNNTEIVGGGFYNFSTISATSSSSLTGSILQSGNSVSLHTSASNLSLVEVKKLSIYPGSTVSNSSILGTKPEVLFPSATVAINTLAQLDNCVLENSISGHGVLLGNVDVGAGDVIMSWNSTDIGYGANQTEDATIRVNVINGGTNKLIINSTSTIPTVYNTGLGGISDVEVVTGLATFDFTLSPNITDYEYRMYLVDAIGSLAGATEVSGEESATGANQSYSYSYIPGLYLAVQILSNPAGSNDYEENLTYYTLGPNDLSVVINLKADNNN